jgi:hypothetical protein
MNPAQEERKPGRVGFHVEARQAEEEGVRRSEAGRGRQKLIC